MNEGHSALLTLEPCSREHGAAGRRAGRRSATRRLHDPHPVPAGHDRFDAGWSGLRRADRRRGRLSCGGASRAARRRRLVRHQPLALRTAGRVNGVAKLHGGRPGDVARTAGAPIDSVTNGVHAVTWSAPRSGPARPAPACDWAPRGRAMCGSACDSTGRGRRGHVAATRPTLLRRVSGGPEYGSTDALTSGSPAVRDLQAAPACCSPTGAAATARSPAAGRAGRLRGQGPPRGRGRQGADRGGSSVRAASADASRVVFLPTTTWRSRGRCRGVDVWLNTPRRRRRRAGRAG